MMVFDYGDVSLISAQLLFHTDMRAGTTLPPELKIFLRECTISHETPQLSGVLDEL
jgi:hypothetical protein